MIVANLHFFKIDGFPAYTLKVVSILGVFSRCLHYLLPPNLEKNRVHFPFFGLKIDTISILTVE